MGSVVIIKDNPTQDEMLKRLKDHGVNIIYEPMVLIANTNKPISIPEAYNLLLNSKDCFGNKEQQSS